MTVLKFLLKYLKTYLAFTGANNPFKTRVPLSTVDHSNIVIILLLKEILWQPGVCEQCLMGYLITLKRSSSTLPTCSWHFQTHPSIKIWRSKQLHLFSAAGLHLSMSTDHKIMDCKLSAKSLSRNVDRTSTSIPLWKTNI